MAGPLRLSFGYPERIRAGDGRGDALESGDHWLNQGDRKSMRSSITVRAVRIWAVSLVLLTGLAGCQKMGTVTREESVLRTDLPDSSFAALQRTRHRANLNIIEDWSWRNGHLQIYVADDEYYHYDDFADVKDLLEKINTWPTLRDSGVSVDAQNVSTGRNDIGDFLYALTEIDERGDRCIVMIQAIPYTTGIGYGPAPSDEASQGSIFFYECWRSGSRSAADLEQRLLSFAKSLTYAP